MFKFVLVMFKILHIINLITFWDIKNDTFIPNKNIYLDDNIKSTRKKREFLFRKK